MGFPSLFSPHDMLPGEPAITFRTDKTFQNSKIVIIQPRGQSSQDAGHSHQNLPAKLCLRAYRRGLRSHGAPAADADEELPSLLCHSTTSLLREI